jgi:CubicO group peptidase (beta-lactamase class C family)
MKIEHLPGVLVVACLLAAQCAGAERVTSALLPPAARRAIDRYVNAELARERIPGAEVGVYRDGHAILLQGYGRANVELDVPVTPATLMQSGSVGKQFAATAVMMLVEEGKVGLDDSIVRYFPDAPESWRPIAVKHLLSHTSGLAEYETDERTAAGADFYLRLDLTEDELVSRIERLPIEFRPGDQWDYRNTNYVLLGALIRRVTGRFYGDFLHERIFAPLGMTATRIISERDIIPGRAAGYEIEGGVLKNQAWVSPTFNSTADGALYFNVVDLERWDRALYGTTLLTRASLDRMWTPFLLNDGKPNPGGYGFAWDIGERNGHRLVWHSGAWQGFTTYIGRFVDDGLTVVVLTNLAANHAAPGNIASVVAGLVEPALMPKPLAAIADPDPATRARVARLLERTLANEDLAEDYAPEAGYRHTPDEGAELAASLPAAWRALPPALVRRSEAGGVVTSRYRVGPPGDARIVTIAIDSAGKLRELVVRPDPDDR